MAIGLANGSISVMGWPKAILGYAFANVSISTSRRNGAEESSHIRPRAASIPPGFEIEHPLIPYACATRQKSGVEYPQQVDYAETVWLYTRRAPHMRDLSMLTALADVHRAMRRRPSASCGQRRRSARLPCSPQRAHRYG